MIRSSGNNKTKRLLASGLVAAGLLMLFTTRDLRAEDDPKTRATGSSAPAVAKQTAQGAADSLKELKEEMQALRLQMNEMQENEKRAKEEARELRRELCLTKVKIGVTGAESCDGDRLGASPDARPAMDTNATVSGAAASQDASA